MAAKPVPPWESPEWDTLPSGDKRARIYKWEEASDRYYAERRRDRADMRAQIDLALAASLIASFLIVFVVLPVLAVAVG